ncbi:MAG: hypothetical protein ACOC1K_04140 [Nanoarchaeota archaeon]
MNDEQLWTFLLAPCYASFGQKGIDKLTELLTEKKLKPISKKIWFEVLPLPPRAEEGNTNLYLAVGQIDNRKDYKSGIKLSEKENKWICFCEMKWNSDISTNVTHDSYRNQLIRVIENALTFQNNKGEYAENVFVTLVTPKKYMLDDRNGIKTKLYHYKYLEYKNKINIEKELEACQMKYYKNYGWSYPKNIAERINNLTLNHKSYDELFNHLKMFKNSNLSEKIIEFWKLYGVNKN